MEKLPFLLFFLFLFSLGNATYVCFTDYCSDTDTSHFVVPQQVITPTGGGTHPRLVEVGGECNYDADCNSGWCVNSICASVADLNSSFPLLQKLYSLAIMPIGSWQELYSLAITPIGSWQELYSLAITPIGISILTLVTTVIIIGLAFRSFLGFLSKKGTRY